MGGGVRGMGPRRGLLVLATLAAAAVLAFGSTALVRATDIGWSLRIFDEQHKVWGLQLQAFDTARECEHGRRRWCHDPSSWGALNLRPPPNPLGEAMCLDAVACVVATPH